MSAIEFEQTSPILMSFGSSSREISIKIGTRYVHVSIDWVVDDINNIKKHWHQNGS